MSPDDMQDAIDFFKSIEKVISESPMDHHNTTVGMTTIFLKIMGASDMDNDNIRGFFKELGELCIKQRERR